MSMRTSRTLRPEYKIEPASLGEQGFQVRVRQYPDGVTAMWFDCGDPHPTRSAAERAIADLLDADG